MADTEPNAGPNDASGPESPAAFEDSMAQVESIIESIESGELGLEESIAAYERAAGLMKTCRESLQKAELRVEEINALLQSDPEAPPADRGGGRS